MTFPYDRPDWRAAADLLAEHRTDDETVLAPDIFHFVVPHIFREVDTRLHPGRDYDWVIVERATMGRFDHEFLRRTLPATMRVALANDTLLVWCRQSMHRVPTLMMATPEVLSFFAAAHELTDDADTEFRHDPVLASPKDRKSTRLNSSH